MKKNILLVIAVVVLTGWFFSSYQLNFQSPIKIKLAMPVKVSKRVLSAETSQPQHQSPLTPLQQDICDKFGKDCKVALAISRAESNYNCQEINVNSDHSVDFGLFMENSIHLNRQFTFADLSSCQTQIDAAYRLFKQQGNWSAWSSYQSGAYKKYLY